MPAGPESPVEVAAAVVANLDSGDEWVQAAASVVDSARRSPGARPLVLLAASLAAPLEGPQRGDPGRDLRRRQRLDHLATLLLALPAEERRRMQKTINGVAAALGADRSLVDLQQRLRIGSLDWRSPGQVRRVLLEAVGQCATRPLHVEGLAQRVQQALDADPAAWDAQSLLRMAGELATRAGQVAPRVAVAVAAAAGPRSGWEERWSALVLSLQDHPEPAVASAARAVLPGGR